MAAMGDALQQYIRAMADPTRGAILLELQYADELTATQLAKRLGLTANNIYHHMRVLRGLGVVDAPRAVPGATYVEKYYRLQPALRAAVRRDPAWVDHTQAQMGPQERKALLIGACLTAAHLLTRAARRYEALDAAALDELAYRQELAMVSINRLGRARLERRLAALRVVLWQEEEAPDTADEPSSAVLMAGLPLLWDAAEPAPSLQGSPTAG